YKKLPESIIIFICKNDPFNLGLQKYTFRTTCEESSSVNLNDMTTKLIYNASAWEKESDPEIKAFLQFISRNNPTNDFTDRLLKSVTEVKRNELFRKEYLSMGVWETDIRHEAMREGMQQGMQQGEQKKAVEDALNLLKENIAPEIISRCCSLPIDEVNRLAMEMKKDGVQL
ncbi:MAG: Rpn family recombination-promoting nuclease/putative transposase, partial [Treponema sp.]|nr:Rpn family recombination-promoting nuclease/putative transposase [Treponema sp.]